MPYEWRDRTLLFTTSFFTCRVSMQSCCHVWPWLSEFLGVALLSCFTLSRSTVFADLYAQKRNRRIYFILFNIHLFWASWVFVTFLFPEVRVHSLQNVKIRSPFFIIVAALGLAALRNHTVLRFLGFIWLFTMDPVSLTFLLKWVNNCWWSWQNRIDLGKCTHQYDEKQGIIVSLLFVV